MSCGFNTKCPAVSAPNVAESFLSFSHKFHKDRNNCMNFISCYRCTRIGIYMYRYNINIYCINKKTRLIIA